MQKRHCQNSPFLLSTAPPSYSEAMQVDRFEYNPEASGEHNSKTNLGFSNNHEDYEDVDVGGQSSPSASAPYPPPGYDYVPNYITYKTQK